MATKHTQGEWKIYTANEGYSYNEVLQLPVIEVSTEGEWIAQVRGNGLEQITANAKLIAAAPQMLEALIDLYNAAGRGNIKNIEKARIKAEAAIKKATE